MATEKEQINFRLSAEGREIADALKRRFGTTLSGVFERLLRDEYVRLKSTEGFSLKRKLGDK